MYLGRKLHFILGKGWAPDAEDSKGMNSVSFSLGGSEYSWIAMTGMDKRDQAFFKTGEVLKIVSLV